MSKICVRKRGTRVIAFAMAFLLMAALPTGFSSTKVEAATNAELQNQIKELQNEEKKLKEQIKALGSSLDNSKARQEALKKQVSNARSQIENLTDQINNLSQKMSAKTTEIESKEKAIAEKEAAISDRFEQLRQRLRAIAKSGNMSKLQMLLSTEEYTDFLIKAKIMERVSENDQLLMDSLEKELQGINEEKEALEKDKAAISEEKKQAEALKKQADNKKKELDSLYAQIQTETKKLQQSLDQQQKELKEMQAEEAKIQKLLQQSTYTGKYGGGTMFWPVPTVRNLSSTYGYRWGKLHKGVDIANGPVKIYGQQIVAAADGVVIRAYTADKRGGGYGYHVVIDHGSDANGKKISTLYAHCSRVYVSVGQKVTGGKTVIALAGDTGNVTGPHLHFEVWENGVAVDPLKKGYIKAN